MKQSEAKNQNQKIYDPYKAHQIFSLNRVAIVTGINKDKLYNNVKGASKSMNLSEDEILQIKSVLTKAQQDFFASLDK